MTDATTPTTNDALQLLPNGTICFRVSGKSITLRPPKFGEYKELRGIINAGIADKTDGDELVEAFVNRALVLLANGEDIPIDERPVWMINATLPSQMTNHWREIPLDLG